MTFPLRQPPRQHHDRHVFGDPPRAQQPHHPLARHGHRIEHFRIHTPWDQPYPARINTMPLFDQPGDETARDDHSLACRHYRIVAALERQVLIVSAVPGGHEMCAGTAARHPGRPRRRTRARMHDIHSFRANDRREQPAIPPNGERILAHQRQRDVPPSGSLDRGHQPTARACHQRRPAGLGDGLGDLDGSAFDAAGHQRRQHLQHGQIACVGRRR